MKFSTITIAELLFYLKDCGKNLNFRNLKKECALSINIASLLKSWTLEGRLNGVWFHVANEGNFGKNARPLYGMLLKSMGKLNGVSDYILLWENGSGILEIKIGKGKLSEAQILFFKWAEKHKIRKEIVTDINQIEPIFKEWGVLK